MAIREISRFAAYRFGENPFFTRDLRRWSRRRFKELFTVLGFTSVPALVLLVAVYLRLQPDSRHSPLPGALLGLVALHFVFCVITGKTVADLVFAEEHRRSTLAGVLLLPYPALRWIALKLAFPLYVVVLAWGAALPLYIVGHLLELGSMSELLRRSLMPLLAGVGVLSTDLLLPPDYKETVARNSSRKAPHPDLLGIDRRARALLPLPFIYVLFFGWWISFQTPGGSLPFYTGRIPGLWLQGLVLGAMLAASTATAASLVQGSEGSERYALILRVVAFAVICAAGLGIFWRTVSPPVEWGTVAALGALLLWELRPQRHGEDPLTWREIAWMRSPTDNPVFLKDLRVHIRRKPFRRSLINEASMLLVIGAGAFAIYRWIAPGSLRSLGNSLPVYTTMALFRTLMTPGNQLAEVWKKERDQQLAPQLLLTPLSSAEKYHGRFLAALLYGWGSHALLLAAEAAVVFWAWGPKWGTGLLLASVFVGLVWASLGASTGSTSSPS